MLPLQSRFFVVNLEPYTYEQFYQITAELLTKWHKVKAIELETYQNSHPDYNIENARKGIDLFRNNIDWRIEALNEKYHAILEDYDFPLHVIKEIIG